jgi:hypothetical protein
MERGAGTGDDASSSYGGGAVCSSLVASGGGGTPSGAGPIPNAAAVGTAPTPTPSSSVKQWLVFRYGASACVLEVSAL